MKKLILNIKNWLYESYVKTDVLHFENECERPMTERVCYMLIKNSKLHGMIIQCTSLEQLQSIWNMVDTHVDRYEDVMTESERSGLYGS